MRIMTMVKRCPKCNNTMVEIGVRDKPNPKLAYLRCDECNIVRTFNLELDDWEK